MGQVGRVGKAAACVLLTLAGLACGPQPAPAAEPARSVDAPASQRVRLFPPQDLGFFDAPDRDEWGKPELVLDELSIADGAVVAELGAGGGWFTVRLAARVGPNGMVYAEDIQPEMIEVIRRRVQNERLQNVSVILGTPRDPRLPGGLDAALIAHTYAELEDPIALLQNVAAALKPQGKIGILDFVPGGGGPGPDAVERVNPDAVVQTAAAAGLKLIARQAAGPFQFLLIFGKAAS